MIVLMERFCSEIRIFDREQQDKMYSPSAYFVAHFVSSIPQLVLQPFLFAVPMYFGCGCRSGTNHVFVYLSTAVVCAFITNGIAWSAVSSHRLFSVASLIGNTSFTFLALCSGYLVNFGDLPVYINWLHYISYMNYGFRVLMINEFGDREFPGCPYPEPQDCVQWNGNDILESRDIQLNDLIPSAMLLVVICVGYHVVSLILLYVNKFPPSGMAGENTGGNSTASNNDLLSEDGALDTDEEQSGAVSGGEHYEYEDADGYIHVYGDDTSRNDDGLKKSINSSSTPVSIRIDNLSIYVRPQPSFISKSWKYCQDLLLMNHGLDASNTSSVLYHETDALDPDDAFENAESGMPELTSEEIAATGSNRRLNANNTNVYTETLRDSLRSSFVSDLLFDKQSKCVLSHVSASIQPGRLVALMGGSGSGKTTLLNLIAGRATFAPLRASPSSKGTSSSEYFGSGRIGYNSNAYTSKSELREMIGYVQQFDFHLPALTVEETMTFNAFIRLPKDMSVNRKLERSQQVIDQLGLSACINTTVGDETMKGISGGEKRRLSVAIQLLSDPDICLLDEPTTGLDAFTARHVVETLRGLLTTPSNRSGSPKAPTLRNRTVILSIHQPRYDIFALLDDVLLLSRGKQMWWGSTQDMMTYFNGLGHPCPELTNPADFILDITSIDVSAPVNLMFMS
jgi:ABC-type multidrug transport system ATPase subunit